MTYSRIIDFVKFSEISKSVDSLLMADIAHIAGLVVSDLDICDFKKVKQIESNNEGYLEQLAVEVVKKELSLPDDAFQYDVELL